MCYTAYVLICQVVESPVPWYDPPDVSLGAPQGITIPLKRDVSLLPNLHISFWFGKQKVPP